MKKTLKNILVLASLIMLLSMLFAQEKPPERIAREHLATGDSLFVNVSDFVGAIENYQTALNMFRELHSDITPFNTEIRDILHKLYAAGTNARNWEVATRYGGELLSLDPSNEAVVRNLAQIYRVGLSDMSRAIEIWKSYDERFDSFTAKQEIADLYSRNNDNTNAILWYHKALEMNKDADLLQKLATLYINTNQPNSAIRIYEDFIESEPSRRQLGIAYRNMGRLYQDMNNINMAIQKYELALEIDYDRNVSLWLVDKFYENGNFEKANRFIDNMISRNANDNDALYFRALILHADGKFPEARAIFQRLVNHATYGTSAQGFIRSIDSAD